MTAYRPATFRAAPHPLFLFQELLDAVLFDEFEVSHHAHMILGAVALIEGLQPATGEISALMAKPNKTFPEQIAAILHEGTVLTAWQTAGAVFPSESLLVQVVFHRQITDA